MWNPNEDRMTAWLDRRAKTRPKPARQNTAKLVKPVVPKLIDVSQPKLVAKPVAKPVAKLPFWERPKNKKLLKSALSPEKKKTARKFYRRVLKEKLDKYNMDNPDKPESWPKILSDNKTKQL